MANMFEPFVKTSDIVEPYSFNAYGVTVRHEGSLVTLSVGGVQVDLSPAEADTIGHAINMASNDAHIIDRKRQRERVQNKPKVVQPELTEEFLDKIQELLDALRKS